MKRRINKLERVDAILLHKVFNRIGRFGWSGFLIPLILLLFTVNRPTSAIQGAETRSFAYGTKVEDFESISGSLNGKNGWTASSGVTVVSDPDSNYGGNRVMRLDGGNRYASKALPEIETSDEYVEIFFRVYRSGSVDGFGGGSDVANPTVFDDFEAQVGSQGGSRFAARDGGAFTEGNGLTFAQNAWHCVWIYSTHGLGDPNDYHVRIKGGQHARNLALGNFDLRNNADEALTTFFARTGNDAGGDLYIDDIYIQKDGGYFADRWDQPAPGCPENAGNTGSGSPDTVVETFDSLNTGAINGQGQWQSNGATVVNDPADAGNQVMQLSSDERYAHRDLDQVLNEPGDSLKSSTLFYRVYRDGTVDGFGGSTRLTSGSAGWGDFVTQFGAQPGTVNDFTVRDGSGFRQTDQTFENRVWYCVWTLTYDEDLSYRIYIEGGPYTNPTLVEDGSIDLYAYRNVGSSLINSFLARSGSGNSGDLYFDDIYQRRGTGTGIPSGVSAADCGRNGPNIEPTPTPTATEQPPTATPTATATEQPPTATPTATATGQPPTATPTATATGQSPTATPTATPDFSAAGWEALANFDTLSNGMLNNQNGWQADGATVTDDPNEIGNKLIALTGEEQYLWKPFPEEVSDRVTLFFRMRRGGTVHGYGGAAVGGTGAEIGDFTTQIGSQPDGAPDSLAIHSADQYLVAPELFWDETWYCVWIVMNNNLDKYVVNLSGGQFSGPTIISAGDLDVFDFRDGNGETSRFLALTGPGSDGILYFDDIFIDDDSTNLDMPYGSCPATDSPGPTATPSPLPPTATPISTGTPTPNGPEPTAAPGTPNATGTPTPNGPEPTAAPGTPSATGTPEPTEPASTPEPVNLLPQLWLPWIE